MFADVAPLRNARHHDSTGALRRRTLVDVPECPVPEARGEEVRRAARRVDVVRGRTVQTGVHQSDVDGAGDGRPVLGEKAFRSLWPREAKSMDRDRSFSAIPRDLNGVGPAAEQVDVFGKDEFLRYLRQGVVVTPDDEDLDVAWISGAVARRESAPSSSRSGSPS